MAVQTIVRDIELPANKPLGERLLPLQHFGPRLEPYQFVLGLLAPELFRPADGLLVEFAILRQRGNARAPGEIFRRRKKAFFAQDRSDVRWALAGGHKDAVIRRRQFRTMRQGVNGGKMEVTVSDGGNSR